VRIGTKAVQIKYKLITVVQMVVTTNTTDMNFVKRVLFRMISKGGRCAFGM